MINLMQSEEFYLGLDEGIRFAVRVLHAHGVDTCQSCQGGEGHSYSVPTVEMVAGPSDATGFVAMSVLQDYGLPVTEVALVWPVMHGLPYEKNWRITFYKTMEDRANERLMFIRGYVASQAGEEGTP